MKQPTTIQVLLADDEVEKWFKGFERSLPEFQFILQPTLTARAVLGSLESHPGITVVILDLLDSNGEQVGVDILRAIPKEKVQVIIYSQVDDKPELVNDCDRAGAYDYLAKQEMSREQIRLKIQAAHQRAVEYRTYWETEIEEFPTKYGIDGRSPAIRKVQALIEKVAPFDVNVLITGETGVGKELVARGLHDNSARKGDDKFFAQNIAAIAHDGNLLQSELFGHEKGAFTGADTERDGLFMQAGKKSSPHEGGERPVGGTVFLDEIGDAPPNVQTALLRVIQERKVKPLGSNIELPSGKERLDFRLICATNRDLEPLMAAGSFRSDLYYRMARVIIPVPLLRERKEDIGILAHQFITIYRKKYEGFLSIPDEMEIDSNDMACLLSYHWPGNVRELEGIIERGLILGDSTSGVFRLWEDDRERMRKKLAHQSVFHSSFPTPQQYWQEMVSGHRERQTLNEIRDTIGKAFALRVYQVAKADEQASRLDQALIAYFNTTHEKTFYTQVSRLKERVEVERDS